MRDSDHDGRFETTEWFGKAPWSVVVEQDRDGDGRPERRYCYKERVLRLKEIDEDSDGVIDLRQYFNEHGKLAKSQERRDAKDHMDITWFYNEAGEAVRGERDKDGDGRPEIWYFYKNGKVTRVEEDTNGDGRPDIWEEYDGAEALVKRSNDLNFDGKADLVKTMDGNGLK